MTSPLIILGAGASYDYSSLGKISPLTNELTLQGYMPPDLLDQYPGAGELLSELVLQVQNKKRAFEEALTEIKKRTAHSPEMQAHFAALEFYLKALFTRISIVSPNPETHRIHQINNYKVLINRLHTYSNGKACIVTFNYDSLFERNMDASLQKMSDYISGDLKVIKLHGSHDWVYVQPREMVDYEWEGVQNNFEWYRKHPQMLEEMAAHNAEPYHEQEVQRHTESGKYEWFPALATPLTNKDRYVCPRSHIQTLEGTLSSVDKILVIGWKAGDPLLLKTLKEHLSNRPKILIVSGTPEDAKQTAQTIERGLGLFEKSVSVYGKGFSDFIADETSHSFFK